jgi:hypothetical protein
LKGLIKMLEDKLNIKLKGEFTLEAIKDGEVVDSFNDNNLVVDGSRAVLASLISGINNPVPLNKLSLGFQGHDDNFDQFTPKVVGQAYGTNLSDNNGVFDESRTQLFSHDIDEDTLDLTWMLNEDSSVQQVAALNINYGTSEYETNSSTADVTVTCNSVIYKFEIEQGVGHGSGDNSIKSYTEAGLFADNILFAIKTFPAKVKDNATKFIITWKIFT